MVKDMLVRSCQLNVLNKVLVLLVVKKGDAMSNSSRFCPPNTKCSTDAEGGGPILFAAITAVFLNLIECAVA